MPSRILKESICTSETINALSPEEEVFFYRLLVQCDDYGRMDARPAILRARCYPLRLDQVSDADISQWLQTLESVGLIQRYTVGGRPYLQMVTWEKHQRIRNRVGKYPAPPEDVPGPREHVMPFERDVEDLVYDALSRCERIAGNKIIECGRQVRVGESYLDIVATTESATYVFEIKRVRLTKKAIEQLTRYTKATDGKGILIGNGLSPEFDLDSCRTRDFAVVSYDDALDFTLVLPGAGVNSLSDIGLDRDSTGNHVKSRSIPKMLESESEVELESESRIRTRAPRSSSTLLPPASPSEQQLLSALQSVAGYPFDEAKDLQFIRQLAEDFPDVDLLAEAKAWRTYKLDRPLEKKSNARSQFRNWLSKARQFRSRDTPRRQDRHDDDDQSRNPIYRDLTEEALREAAEAGLLEPEDEL